MEPALDRVVDHGSPEYAATVALRDAVLRRPLGLAFTAEELAAEADQVHLCVWQGGAPLACAVLVPVAGAAMKLRQMAVHPDHQRRGLGRRLMRFAEQVAAERGARRVVLHARETAVPFYEKLGYQVRGERFTEVTLPHFVMEKACAP